MFLVQPRLRVSENAQCNVTHGNRIWLALCTASACAQSRPSTLRGRSKDFGEISSWLQLFETGSDPSLGVGLYNDTLVGRSVALLMGRAQYDGDCHVARSGAEERARLCKEAMV